MKRLRISFLAGDASVSQVIDIDDHVWQQKSDASIIDALNNGFLLTTLQQGGDIIDRNFNTIGKVNRTFHELELCNFSLVEI